MTRATTTLTRAEAYGWSDLGPVPWTDESARAAWTETMLERLVALNAKRAAEEAADTVRWLCPEFQDLAQLAAAAATAPPPWPVADQAGIDGVESEAVAEARADAASDGTQVPTAAPAGVATAQPWTGSLPEQGRAVAQLLGASPAPPLLAATETRFKGKGPWKKGLPRILDTLEALDRAQRRHTDAGGVWRG